jgi:hypothetical protein
LRRHRALLMSTRSSFSTIPSLAEKSQTFSIRSRDETKN